MPFEAGKTYRTRDGREARVYATDGRGSHGIHGAIFGDTIRGVMPVDEYGWYIADWTKTGSYQDPNRENPGDLMPAEALEATHGE